MEERENLSSLTKTVCENLSVANEFVELVDMYIEGDRKLYQLVKIIDQKIKMSLSDIEKLRNLICAEED